MKLQQAKRSSAKIKIGLQGVSGGGKTYSALLLAKGLCGDWSKVAVIDTENHSADLYAQLGNYFVLHLEAPFTPEMYIKAIQLCEDSGMEVIIIDSISHEWEGTGGILDIHSNMLGNSFTNWSKLTPRHNGFIQKILQSPAHIISTIRAKQDYVLSEKTGKYVPEKVGLKGITRDGMDYEMTIVFDISINHQVKASKDRTGLFDKSPEFTITEKTGERISKWCTDVTSREDVISKIASSKSIAELTEVFHSHPEFRETLTAEFARKKQELLQSKNSLTPKFHPMELVAVNNLIEDVVQTEIEPSNFIGANTISSSTHEIKCRHIIPVFTKDNETTISHTDFIETTIDVAKDFFHGLKITTPSIRVSHPVKGRIPEARNKQAKELLEHEKTLYYERMAFMVELPDISKEINGNKLSLVVGGVKAYNEDNLYNKKGSAEHFKIFIGFQNKVCLNLCIWTDGLKADIRVTNTNDLARNIYELVSSFQAERQLELLHQFTELCLSEHQFAQMIGKAKLYQYISAEEKKEIVPFLYGDYHMNTVAKDYYNNQSFCRDRKGNINLWNLYNLFTGANKSSYIDKFLERGLNATQFVNSISESLLHSKDNWFLN